MDRIIEHSGFNETAGKDSVISESTHWIPSGDLVLPRLMAPVGERKSITIAAVRRLGTCIIERDIEKEPPGWAETLQRPLIRTRRVGYTRG